jgi:propionyl-CoA carboxylase alpha chain
MRIVRNERDLSSSFASAQSEARSAFGDPRVYIEKYLEGPRHVEFQILADQYGNTIHLGERECTIQRRHQKVIEETPSVIVDDRMRALMGATAVNAAKACGYRNAGTIEFLVDADRRFYFLEMNTRLQVEHPVTELRTGMDLVAQQIRIAEGEELGIRQDDVQFRGHAIECRICAEDVENGFLPVTGRLTHLKPSQGIGVRDDRGVEAGNDISVYYDSLIAKLIVWGSTRGEAIERMKRALAEYEILGVRTTIPLCQYVMQHPKFIEGDFTTHFLNDHFPGSNHRQQAGSTRIAAAILCALIEDRARQGTIMPDNLSSAGNGAAWKMQRLSLMRS